MSDKKKLIKGVLILLFSLLYLKSFGQTKQSKFNRDSSKTITLVEFNQRVNRGIFLLKTKTLSTISDTDHISMMMCYNTIFMTSLKEHGEKISELQNGDAKIIAYQLKQRFSGGQYDKLFNMMDNRLYFDEIRKLYPKWIPNRGMGMYFPEIQMEIGGTPMRYAIFTVTE